MSRAILCCRVVSIVFYFDDNCVVCNVSKCCFIVRVVRVRAHSSKTRERRHSLFSLFVIAIEGAVSINTCGVLRLLQSISYDL